MLKIILAVLFAFLIVGGVILFVVFLVVILPGYCCCCDSAKTKFKFKDFKRLYDVIPEKFYLYENYAYFHSDCIGFKLFGYIRYCLFYYFEEKRKDKINTKEEYVRILENAQNDIEEKREQIHKETIRNLQKIKDEVTKK